MKEIVMLSLRYGHSKNTGRAQSTTKEGMGLWGAWLGLGQ
jgi:hypothetical protein